MMKLIILSLLVGTGICNPINNNNTESSLIKKFQEYVKFNTISESQNYEGVSSWLIDYIKEIGLEVKTVGCNAKKPIIIGTLKGKNPDLQTILLNSHYDVVPVNRELWNSDPFGAEIKEFKGEEVIIGRGTQDDKCIAVMQLEALRKLKLSGFEPSRTIHISIVPGEEINDPEGMDCLIKDPSFKSLNIGTVLDEGFPSPDNNTILYYGERTPWSLNVTAKGNTGHSSKFIGNLAINKLSKFIEFAEEFRKSEESKLNCTDLGDTTTMNLARIGGGTANNVVPDTLWAVYSLRVSPSFGTKKMHELLDNWALKSNVTFTLPNPIEPTVSPNDSNAHFYNAIVQTSKDLGMPLKSQIFPGATDSRKLRLIGTQSYGITPCNNVEVLAHDHNEYIPIRCLKDGLNFYINLLPNLAKLKEL